MATGTLSAESAQPTPNVDLGATANTILKPLASLRLTVVLFALGIFIIFVGTLAQVEKDMWEVIDLYFRSFVAWIDLQVFFPYTWFPELAGQIPGRFPMPGGFSIGVLMSLNLVAAHLVRFKVQTKGPQLLLGLSVLAVGAIVTYWVIASGHNRAGLQGAPPFSYATLWMVIRMLLFGLAVASSLALAFSSNASSAVRSSLLCTVILCGGLGIWALMKTPSDPSLRILWQLIQGGLAGAVLLIGCLIAFKKRAGIVLLHGGIALMMFSEFFVSQYAVEGRMTIREGETMNYLRDIRTTELAVVSDASGDKEEVVTVPSSRLLPRESFWGQPEDGPVNVASDQLPFDIHVEKYIKNAAIVSFDVSDVAMHLKMIDMRQYRTARISFRQRTDGKSLAEHLTADGYLTPEQLQEVQAYLSENRKSNYANTGSGLEVFATEVRAAAGTDGGQVDLAATYVELKEKGSDTSLGRYLLSQQLAANQISEDVKVGDKTYQVALRFKRTYKPYSIALKDVRKDDYMGTNTPMNYSSDVVLTEGEKQVGEFKIWMNNPLRYAGETFYQSGYTSAEDGGGVEVTDLQVVTNTGWMMPYVGCMLVMVGMGVHFSGTLWRFLSRRSRDGTVVELAPSGKWGYVVPGLVVLVFVGYVGSKMRPPTDTKANMRIHEVGKLPVVYQGRVKPLDTLARNTLRIVSNKETVDDYTQFDPKKSRQKQIPAIRWLLDVMAGSPDADKHRVYRIDNLDVLQTLELPRRKRFRYAREEFINNMAEFEAQVIEARKLETEELSFYQRKLLETESRMRAVRLIEVAFSRIIPPMPTEEQYKSDQATTMQTIQQIQRMLMNLDLLENELNKFEPPLSIPVPPAEVASSTSTDDNDDEPKTKWVAFSTAWNHEYGAKIMPERFKTNEAALLWDAILHAYAANETKTFNDSVAEYQTLLGNATPTNLDQKKVEFEHFFNSSQPFKYCLVLYIVAFSFVCIGWVMSVYRDSRAVNRTAFYLLIFTFIVHTLALGARIYISGRPPITNLYSSAVFIGWSAVGLGLLLELVYGRGKAMAVSGVGNALAAVTGFSTLQIAYALAADGDTFTVLQAVLDTQFWLATHVVCVTLGYATTYVAGALGLIYLLSFAWRNSDMAKALASMIYGTLCFAIFFSFVGTVLGGLWADDSWGRFWGWDPKENGALIIVLWNALVLHARWGGMIKHRGMAILAVIGNITTSWSWFGVNELGVGLHSYGFTEGVLRVLGIFIASQLIVIVVGLMMMSLTNDKPKSAVAS